MQTSLRSRLSGTLWVARITVSLCCAQHEKLGAPVGHASVLLAFCATDSSEGKWCSRECLGAERDLSIDALFWVAGVGRSGDGIAMIQIAPDGGRKVCSGDSTVDRDRDVSSLGDDVTTPTDLQSGAAVAILPMVST